MYKEKVAAGKSNFFKGKIVQSGAERPDYILITPTKKKRANYLNLYKTDILLLLIILVSTLFLGRRVN